MKKIEYLVLVFAFIFTDFVYGASQSPQYQVYLNSGYFNGFSILLGFGINNISPALPIGVEADLGYTHQSDPGRAVEARKVFINDGTAGNNNVKESATMYSINVDFKYPLYKRSNIIVDLYVGPRYADYSAQFEYSGGNEQFAPTSKNWGLGTGLKTSFEITRKMDIGFNTGIDYFFPSTISGHGQFYYNPSGVDDNPRNNYTYADADNVIDQPAITPKFLFFIGYKL